MKHRYAILLVLGVWGVYNCQDPNTDKIDDNGLTSTLNQDEVGDGTIGYIEDYFYTFDQDVDVDYYRFDPISFNFSYQQYRSLYGREPSKLNFRTFPEYLLKITSDDNSDYTHRTRIDSLTQYNYVLSDSVTQVSDQFKDVESLTWDFDLDSDKQRYKINTSDYFDEDTTFAYYDTLDWYAYAAVQQESVTSGITFVDTSEWVDTTFTEATPRQIEYSFTFDFMLKIISQDSLVFRLNTDCNDDGVWTDAEVTDTGNGIWDPREIFYDMDEDGTYDLSEPFDDRNCNGTWDPAEDYVDDNGNGQYDEGESFTDRGNDRVDGAETFTDLNGNGVGDPGELFLIQETPNRFLVSYDWYPRIDTARVLLTVVPGDSLVNRWGRVYHNILDVIPYQNEKIVRLDDLDSLVTLYTNQVVEHVDDDPVNIGDYFVTKTEWFTFDPAISQTTRDYDYLLFKQNEHIYKLEHPSYFKPDGYYWLTDDREEGFWFEDRPVEKVLYYSPNGLLRNGEYVESDTTIETPTAEYNIVETYSVDNESVTVPGKKMRGFVNGSGNKVCNEDTTMVVDDFADCPAQDTTFTDCFKITREMTMTMIGTGLEYGEKNITWLVRDYGIVRDEVYVRWSEAPGTEGKQWQGYSRWELGRVNELTSSTNRGFLGRYNRSTKVVSPDGFENEPELNFDPYKITRTSGLQRVEFPLNQ